MTVTKYIILMLIGLVGSSFVVSVSDVDPFFNAFLAGGALTNALRVGILVLLVTLLFTNPPRSYRLRMLSGVTSLIMLSMSMMQLMAFNTYIVDAVIYLELAIIFAIEALELHTQNTTHPSLTTRRQKVSTSSVV